MPDIVVSLNIPAEEYVRLYTGTVRDVQTHARNGQSVRFPAAILRPFVTRAGVHGDFRIRFDAQGKFVAIDVVAS